MRKNFISFKFHDQVVFGRNRFAAPFKISDALINEARIVHIVSGHSRLYTASNYYALSAGDTFIMKTDNFVNQWYPVEKESHCEVIVFQLTSEFLHTLYAEHLPSWLLKNNHVQGESVQLADAHPIIMEYFQLLQQYIDSPELLNSEMVAIKVKELISLLTHTDVSGEIIQLFSRLFTATEYRFQQVIQAKLYEELSLDDLAFLTNTSVSSFKRKFNQIYGTSPTKYFMSKRMQKAQKLLENTELRVAEVAYDVGFSDVAYFSKTFKKYYHRSPSELKK